MNSLVKDKDIISLHPLIRSAIFHAEFIRIHPFPDGNGRTGRLMSNYILIREDMPSISIVANDRDKYNDALDTAIETHNIDKLIDLFYNSMLKTIDNLHKCFDNIVKNENLMAK